MSYMTEDEWTGEETETVPKVNNTTQSLLWNCNDGQLYWAWLNNPDEDWWVYATVFRISADGWQCTPITRFFNDPVVALYARNLDRTGQPDWAAATGENLYTSDMAKGGLPAWDMTACRYLGQPGDGVSIYGTYMSAPCNLKDNMLLTAGFDLSTYLYYNTDAIKLVAVASGGYQQATVTEEQEDGSTKEVTYDTEVFYLMDDSGYVWVLRIYQTDDGYGALLSNLLTTDLTGKLPYLGDGDFQRCSMVYDQDSGALILSYFNGDSAELYLLYAKEADSTNLTAIHLGDLGRDVYAAALYDVSVANVESARALTDMDGLAISVDGSVSVTQTAISRSSVMVNAGSLNAAQPDAPEEPVNPPKTGDFAPLTLWCAMLAAVPAAALVLYRRKKHN